MAWQKNAEHQLVTFAFDKKDRLIGKIEHQVDHLDPEELELYVNTLARLHRALGEAMKTEGRVGGISIGLTNVPTGSTVRLLWA